MHAAEVHLFGGSAEQGGQGIFQLSLGQQNIRVGKISGKCIWQSYLMGQGLWHFRDGCLRPAVLSGEITARLLFRPKSADDDIESVKNALYCLGTLGGLGSRSRKGFGSLSLISSNKLNSVPKNSGEFKTFVANIIGSIPQQNALPTFSAFSSWSRIEISMTGSDAWDLLGAGGKELQMYRSYGRNSGGVHKVNGLPAEQNFSEDHDLIRNAAAGTCPNELPQRAVFGLPHNYFFSSDNAKVDIAPSANKRTRRASPLLMHVHAFPDGTFGLIHTLLPAKFLPEGDPVEFKAKKLTQCRTTNTEVDWEVIHEYLSRYQARSVIY
ncbi:MAG: hypothetical protein D6698_11310, partial [Gammaproteobacteria bacterium]